MTDVRIDDLPETIQSLVDLIGIDATMRIVEERGGIRLYVPKTADQDHPIAGWIGTDPFEALVSMYGGEEIDVPRCEAAMQSVKRRQILIDLQSNSIAMVARKHQYTERGVRKLLRRAEANGDIETNQMDLFNS